MVNMCETGCQGLVNMPKVETRGVSWGRGGEGEGIDEGRFLFSKCLYSFVNSCMFSCKLVYVRCCFGVCSVFVACGTRLMAVDPPTLFCWK